MSDESKVQGEGYRLNDRRFNTMTPGEKLSFFGKVAVFLVSGGFLFPTIWID